MFPAKEFIDKTIAFSSNGAVYFYASCIQNIADEDIPRSFKDEKQKK